MKKAILIFAVACGTGLSFSFGKAAHVSRQRAMQTQPAKEEKYRLVVSFVSKGAGTDGEKRKKFLEFVDTHAKKPVYKTVIWGREGESDYCFNLHELSKKEQAEFVSEVKKITAGSEIIFVDEHMACKHQSRLRTKN